MARFTTVWLPTVELSSMNVLVAGDAPNGSVPTVLARALRFNLPVMVAVDAGDTDVSIPEREPARIVVRSPVRRAGERVFIVARLTPAAVSAARELLRMGIGVTVRTLIEPCDVVPAFPARVQCPGIILMALDALEVGMGSLERKSRRCMIELRRCDLVEILRRVTRRASPVRELSFVDILMARFTLEERKLNVPNRVSVFRGWLVAFRAGDLLMLAGQWVCRTVMEESRSRLPVVRPVTLRAILRELTSVFVEVAGDACCAESEERVLPLRGLKLLHIIGDDVLVRMAAAAADLHVFPLEAESDRRMVKRARVEPGDLELPSVVFRMTLLARRVLHRCMVSTPGLHSNGDLRVTREAVRI